MFLVLSAGFSFTAWSPLRWMSKAGETCLIICDDQFSDLYNKTGPVCLELLSTCRTSFLLAGFEVLSKILFGTPEASHDKPAWIRSSKAGMTINALVPQTMLTRTKIRTLFPFLTVCFYFLKGSIARAIFFLSTKALDPESNCKCLLASDVKAGAAFERALRGKLIWTQSIVDTRFCQLFVLMAMEETLLSNFQILLCSFSFILVLQAAPR